MTKCEAGARQARLDRPDRDPERCRDFLVAETIDLTQHHGDALIEGQGLERGADAVGRLPLLEQRIRQRRPPRLRYVAMGGDVLLKRDLLLPTPPTPPSPTIGRLGDHDAVDPGAERGVAAKLWQRSEDPEEDFLREIQRLLGIAEEVERQMMDHALVVGHETGARRLIAGGAGRERAVFQHAQSTYHVA